MTLRHAPTRFAALVLGTLLAGTVALAPLPAFAQQAVAVVVNGQTMSFDQPPIVQAGRVFVPLRGVFEQLGASVVYSNGQINATGRGRTVSLTIGSTQGTVNGQPVTLDVAPFVVGSRTLVPLRFVAESLGATVNWDDSTSTVTISSGTVRRSVSSNQITVAPPPLPVYDQPPVPAPNYLWTPGYWAWAPAGYYWVPGAWVAPPQTGVYWTPGYWSAGTSGGFVWNAGYWGPQVGFYGGVSYGFGYFGTGYNGGRWGDGGFAYNTAYTNINRTVITNTYINKTVINTTTINRVSYNGGTGGIRTRPTAQELAAANHRVPQTQEQIRSAQAAAQNHDLYYNANHGKPPVAAEPKPLGSAPKVAPPAQKPEARPTARPEPKATPVRPEPKATVPPPPRATARPAPIATVRPEPRATLRPEPKATLRPEPKPTVRPASKPVAPESKPVEKPEVKPTPKPTDKPPR